MKGRIPTMAGLARQLERWAKQGKISGVVIACVMDGKPRACWASEPLGSNLAALVGAAAAAAAEVAWGAAGGVRAQWLYSPYTRRLARKARKRKRRRR